MTRVEQKAATQAKIIAAARHAFQHQGYEEVTVRQLAKAVGMSTGAIFAHAASKGALFEMAMGEPAPDVIAFLDEVIATARQADQTKALGGLRERAVILRGHLRGHHA